jgi:CTP:molybdopterin cytidylyltransferase MocA
VTTAAVLLAAGSGSRFGGDVHKLLAPLRGRTVLAHALEGARGAGLDEVIVVLGALTPEQADLPDDVTVVVNQDWAEGQAGSLRVGVQVARAHGHDAVVVGLGDQPMVGPATWQAVAAGRAAPIVVADYGRGRRRPPVRLGSSVWDLLPAGGDEGARALMRSRPDLVAAVACPGDPADVDTPEDLRPWS